jgi:hypothetical protein
MERVATGNRASTETEQAAAESRPRPGIPARYSETGLEPNRGSHVSGTVWDQGMTSTKKIRTEAPKIKRRQNKDSQRQNRRRRKKPRSNASEKKTRASSTRCKIRMIIWVWVPSTHRVPDLTKSSMKTIFYLWVASVPDLN